MTRRETLVLAMAAATLVACWTLGPARRKPPASSLPPPAASGPSPAPAAPSPAMAVASAPLSIPAAATIDPARLGPATAAVTLVVAGDFTCAGCKRAERTALALRETRPEEVAILFRQAPAPGDERAMAAALAALAAGRQGRFWPYHDRLVAGGTADAPALSTHATAAGLDLARFERDRADPALREQVERDRASLRALGAAAPGVLVNGRWVKGEPTLATLRDMADAERQAARDDRARGVPPDLVPEARARANTGPLFEAYWRGVVLGEAPASGAAVTAAATPVPAPLATRFDATVWKAEVLGNEPVKGNSQALVTVVEFGDFDCPWCARAAEMLDRLLERHPQDVRIVWKSVVSNPERSRAAAEAALAAHDRGKFWEMHRTLFANPSHLSDEDLGRYGQDNGVGKDAVLDAVRNRRHQDVLDRDQDLARKLSIRGAPIFFVNGRLVDGFRELDEFEALVEEELAKARARVSATVPPGSVYAQILSQARFWEPLGATVHPFRQEGRPVRGAADGDIVLTEFVDYEFYSTADTEALVEALLADPRLGGRIKVVVKQLPHPAHALGREAAAAALAAHEQGKFWEMHARLVACDGTLKPWLFEGFAREIGLDLDRFRSFVAQGRGRRILEEDALEGRAAGKVSGPSLFLDGRRIEIESSLTRESLAELVRRSYPER